MGQWLLANATAVYGVVLVGGFLVASLWETARPLCLLRIPCTSRWFTNLALLALNQSAAAVVLPLAGVSAAFYTQERDWGLFNVLAISDVVALIFALVVLDFRQWAVHFAMHKLGPLWRVHRVHHSDVEYDCTLQGRFHPIEAIISASSIALFVAAFGIPPEFVLVSQTLSLINGFVVHGNVALPESVDRVARKLFVTPSVHRIHHSARVGEAQSNYGGTLLIWDRLFGTFRAVAVDSPQKMPVGLAELRDPRELTLWRLLRMPFERVGRSAMSLPHRETPVKTETYS